LKKEKKEEKKEEEATSLLWQNNAKLSSTFVNNLPTMMRPAAVVRLVHRAPLAHDANQEAESEEVTTTVRDGQQVRRHRRVRSGEVDAVAGTVSVAEIEPDEVSTVSIPDTLSVLRAAHESATNPSAPYV
jgi:hypothetical protein